MMILAAAQFNPVSGNPQSNIQVHVEMVRKAAGYGAGLILFPEMSLTGYLRERADALAYEVSDPRPDVLRQLASSENILIVAGAPVLSGKDLHIGAVVFLQDGSFSVYCKKYLHQGEEKFFKPSRDHDPVIRLHEEKISLAICADIENPDHPGYAKEMNGCSLYLASIFYSIQGIQRAHNLLAGYAQKYGMNVLMANYCGKQQGTEAGGGSAFWDDRGNRVASMDPGDTGLLIVEKKDSGWFPFMERKIL